MSDSPGGQEGFQDPEPLAAAPVSQGGREAPIRKKRARIATTPSHPRP
jgi:hypothetical protein